MIVFPNCKINIGLNILSKRNDGYHNLETIFYPIPFTDILEIITNSENTENEQLQFSQTGISIAGSHTDNLCVKAANLLKNEFSEIPALAIHLHKLIPSGAGLGGGSADASFVLKLLNEKYQLQLSEYKLMEYAALLGSDCPFFIKNSPCLAKGRGEILTPIELNLTGYKIVLINPGIHITTATAFQIINPQVPEIPLSELITEPIDNWKMSIKNDFETGVFAMYPAIASIKEQLYHSGAVYAAMSGSGSTVFGIFSASTPVSFNFPATYWVKEIQF